MSAQIQQLGDIASISVGMPTKQEDLTDAERSNPILTVRCLTGRGIDTHAIQYLDLADPLAEKYRVKRGDVLLPSRSTSLKIDIVPRELEGSGFNATLIAIRSHHLHPRLLRAYLTHPRGQEAIMAISQSATLQMNITVSALHKLMIPIPPVKEQERMVQLIEVAETAYENALKSAETRWGLAQELVVMNMFNLQNTEGNE